MSWANIIKLGLILIVSLSFKVIQRMSCHQKPSPTLSILWSAWITVAAFVTRSSANKVSNKLAPDVSNSKK